MTLSVDCFWSFRSPYSYLATARMQEWERDWDLRFRIRPVYPLAVRVEGFFEDQHPQWLPYLRLDCAREAARLGIPLAPPMPDPIQMDMATGKVDKHQPYITHLTRLGIAACEAGSGLSFIAEISKLIWSGSCSSWYLAPNMAQATERAGLDYEDLLRKTQHRATELDELIEKNETDQAKAGHWGVPLFSFENEPFFGQDRMDALLWRLQERGLKTR